MSGSMTIKDNGFRKVVDQLKSLDAFDVVVGIHAEKGGAQHDEESGLTIAEIGAFHEFGLGDVPRRSFIADWADENQEARMKFVRGIQRQVAKGKLDADTAANRIGLRFQSEIQKRIRDTPGDWPALHPMTIKRKGSSKPLIDTGALRGSITYKVIKR